MLGDYFVVLFFVFFYSFAIVCGGREGWLLLYSCNCVAVYF